MAGGSFSVRPITSEVAEGIRRRQSVVNRGILYVGGAAILTLAAEKVYSVLGGDPTIANHLFQVAGYTLLAAGTVAYCNYSEIVLGPGSSRQTSHSLDDTVEE